MARTLVGTGANGKPAVITSSDDWKDQTYFLFTLKPEILSKLLFPVGDWEKPALRKYAEEKGLVNAQKKDSTGICFVGNTGYSNFIEEHASSDRLQKGVIRRYPSGEVMAEHKGIHHFTLGQRKGLGMDYHETLFVLRIDPEDQTVWVGEEKYLFSSKLYLTETNWLDDFSEGEKLRVKIRFHHKGAEATIKRSKEDPNCAWVEFDQPQRAITPGQAAVAYRDNQLVGGGWISPESLEFLKPENQVVESLHA